MRFRTKAMLASSVLAVGLLAFAPQSSAQPAGGGGEEQLTQEQIDDITAYLIALTDPRARNLKGITPVHVPSGLTPPGAPVLAVPPIKPLASRTGGQ